MTALKYLGLGIVGMAKLAFFALCIALNLVVVGLTVVSLVARLTDL